jgi:hypothetical protein
MKLTQTVSLLWKQRHERKLTPEELQLAREGKDRDNPRQGVSLFFSVEEQSYSMTGNLPTVVVSRTDWDGYREQEPAREYETRTYTPSGLLIERTLHELTDFGTYAPTRLELYTTPGTWLPSYVEDFRAPSRQ